MKLYYSPRSPFVRKVMIVLHETGQFDDVEYQRELVALHLPPNAEVLSQNPLGKIPTLITDDGTNLFDSRVICEFLNQRAGGSLFPKDAADHFFHHRLQALADGMTDCLLLWRTELSRPQGAWAEVVNGWRTKVQASMAELEVCAGAMQKNHFGIGHIAVVCALGQLDFRWPDCGWRDHFPSLADREAEFAQRPSVASTKVPEEFLSEGAELTSGQLEFGA